MTVVKTFLDLPENLSAYDSASAVVMLLPYEATTTYGKGTAAGPEAIVAASTQVELYDEELAGEPAEIGIATWRPPELFSEAPELAVAQIAEFCKKHLQHGKYVVGLGGEHTVTVGMVRSFVERYPGLSVLQLDAHSDLRNSYQGSPLNHACVMRRINEMCRYIGVGVRSGIAGERDVLNADSAIFYAHEMQNISCWSDDVISKLGPEVYVTIDLDFFDPAVVPSVGTPEPGGFHWYETMSFLKSVVASRKVVGFDVVELCPQPGWPASDFFAAKLVYKLLSYVFDRRYA